MEIDKIYITLSSWYSRHLINNALAQSVHLSLIGQLTERCKVYYKFVYMDGLCVALGKDTSQL